MFKILYFCYEDISDNLVSFITFKNTINLLKTGAGSLVVE